MGPKRMYCLRHIHVCAPAGERSWPKRFIYLEKVIFLIRVRLMGEHSPESAEIQSYCSRYAKNQTINGWTWSPDREKRDPIYIHNEAPSSLSRQPRLESAWPCGILLIRTTFLATYSARRSLVCRLWYDDPEACSNRRSLYWGSFVRYSLQPCGILVWGKRHFL